MKNEIMLLGEKCKLEFGYYPNKTIAITAIRILNDEQWCVATVNYERQFQVYNYNKQLCFPLVVIKNYSENDGIYQQLIDAGVITIGAYLSGSAGTVQSGILTDEWQAFAKKQLVKKNRIAEIFTYILRIGGHVLKALKS